jgi:methionyl-tRNA formyltransferase
VTVRIAFLGTPGVAVPPLEALIDDERVEVVVVITNPDRPRGRSGTPQPPPVKVAALEHGVEVWQPTKPREVVTDLRALDLDAAAVVAYGALLPTDVLESTAHGFVNLHYSLLPRWRGAAPVQHAVMAGDEVTGLTTFVLDEGMDTGPVLQAIAVPIRRDATSGDLFEELTQQGARVLADSVVGLVDGSITPTPQPDRGATLAPKLATEDVRIDWSRSAGRVSALVRGANPRPGAHTTWRGERCKVWHARVADPVVGSDAVGAPPGTVVGSTDEGPVVACGSGAVVLTSVQPANRPRQSGRDFVNGQQPAADERFGG